MGPRPGSSRVSAKPIPDASSASITSWAISPSDTWGAVHDGSMVVSYEMVTHRLTCPNWSRIYCRHASEDGEIGRRTSLRDWRKQFLGGSSPPPRTASQH